MHDRIPLGTPDIREAMAAELKRQGLMPEQPPAPGPIWTNGVAASGDDDLDAAVVRALAELHAAKREYADRGQRDINAWLVGYITGGMRDHTSGEDIARCRLAMMIAADIDDHTIEGV